MVTCQTFSRNAEAKIFSFLLCLNKDVYGLAILEAYLRGKPIMRGKKEEKKETPFLGGIIDPLDQAIPEISSPFGES